MEASKFNKIPDVFYLCASPLPMERPYFYTDNSAGIPEVAIKCCPHSLVEDQLSKLAENYAENIDFLLTQLRNAKDLLEKSSQNYDSGCMQVLDAISRAEKLKKELDSNHAN